MPSFFSATDSRLEWSGAAINDPFPLLSCNAQAVAHDHGPRLRPMGSDGRPGSFDGSGLAALEPRGRQSWPWGPRSSGCRRVRAGGASAARKITVEPLRIARLWRACCRSGCDAHRLECDDATWPVALIRGGACPVFSVAGMDVGLPGPPQREHLKRVMRQSRLQMSFVSLSDRKRRQRSQRNHSGPNTTRSSANE